MYALLISLLLSFQMPSIEGHWISIDDETGLEKSEIYLYIQEGKLYGKINRLLLEEDQGKRCEKCQGSEKNQPIEGLVIVQGLTYKDGLWTDGKIMDPANGKRYDCTIRINKDRTLNVRGYLGFSFLGRSQVWKRHLE